MIVCYRYHNKFEDRFQPKDQERLKYLYVDQIKIIDRLLSQFSRDSCMKWIKIIV